MRLPLRAAVLVSTLGLLTAGGVTAQTTTSATVRLAALKRFDAWVGKWSGSGWSLDRTGKRTEFNLVESVAPKVGGTILLIEGHGTAIGDSATTTHDGVVLLSYDERSSQYRWNGHDIGSRSVDAEVKPIEGGLVWTIPAGPSGGTVRFTILFDERRWHEFGEASADGTTWGRFMEIDLKRVQ